MNPCPCGYFGTDRCLCGDADISRYQKKLSGPLLDRIDLKVELRSLTTDERFADPVEGESDRLRAKVEKARTLQRERFQDSDIPFNAAIVSRQRLPVESCKTGREIDGAGPHANAEARQERVNVDAGRQTVWLCLQNEATTSQAPAARRLEGPNATAIPRRCGWSLADDLRLPR